LRDCVGGGAKPFAGGLTEKEGREGLSAPLPRGDRDGNDEPIQRAGRAGRRREMSAKKGVRKEQGAEPKALRWGIHFLLFCTNFLLLYFIWVVAFPGVAGLVRLLTCWLGAYGMTWLIARRTGLTARLLLALGLLAMLLFVLFSRG